MKRITIDLPLPPPELSPNRKDHWTKKRDAVAAYRQSCMALAKMALNRNPPPQAPVVLHLYFYLCRKNARPGQFYYPRDEDNARAACKAMQDGLKDAGMFPDDSAQHVKLGETRIYSSAKEHQGKTGLLVVIETQKAQSVQPHIPDVGKVSPNATTTEGDVSALLSALLLSL